MRTRLLAAAALAAAGLAFASSLWPAPAGGAPDFDASLSSPALSSPASARALGARWRTTRRADQGRAYAQALLAAGLPDELLGAIENNALFSGDPDARALFRGEALLRLYRYDAAVAEASLPALADNPYAAFIRVRAQLSAGKGLDREALSLATRGPADLAREAWLIRARAGLDLSEFSAADAALRRAAEAGASQAQIEPFAIERDIRAGDAGRASAALERRATSLAGMAAERGETLLDYEGLRLAVMLALRSGNGRDAARLVDRASLGAPGGRDAPLAALAKWVAGDTAQAQAILAAHLRAAPGDWVALDLAAALASQSGRDAEADRLLADLSRYRPRLAALRRMEMARANGDLDEAYAFIAGLSGEEPLQGAVSAMLGAGALLPLPPEPHAADAALAALSAGADPGSVHAGVKRLLALRRSSLDLAAAAEALARVGAKADAAALAFDAGQAAAGFFAPVALRAGLLEGMGRGPEAVAHIQAFLAAHPDRAAARMLLAGLYAKRGDHSAAAETFAAVDAALVFGDDEVSLDYAKAATAAGEPFRQAMLTTARLAISAPARLGLVLAAAGDDAGAADAFRAALIADPRLTDARLAYRTVMARLGRETEADALLEAITRRERENGRQSALSTPATASNADF
ncbi:MAG: hypothetical protein ACKVS5_16030 [Parvularculaceae bacterium]